LEKHEIQSNDLTEIASFAAREIAQSKRLPIITEDAGFFVKSLGGFPGPYSSYVFKTLGLQGILKLMSKNNQREASFQAAVAFFQPKARPACFAGAVKGQVSERPRGTHGFGFDPIFIPDQGDGRTFGEMTIEEKNTMSHRAIALSKFSNWFLRAKRATPPYRGG
jgi:XTP/dITP diphosphohydrolase